MKNKIKSICQTGGKKLLGREINEDVVSVSRDGKICILMDGATGLGGPKSIDGQSSAEWYVNKVSNYLKKALYDYSKDIKTIVREAVEYVSGLIRKYEKENNMKFELYTEPSSSLIIVREEETQLQIYEIGDSRVALKHKDGRCEKLYNPNEIKLGELDESVLKKMIELAKENNKNVIDTVQDVEVQDLLKANRALKNTPEGYYVLGTSTEAVDHGVLYAFDKADIKQILLFSDGFNFEILGLNLEEVMEKSKTQAGLEGLQKKIREEEELDKGGNKQARFKVSDDMSVIMIDNKIRENLVENIEER